MMHEDHRSVVALFETGVRVLLSSPRWLGMLRDALDTPQAAEPHLDPCHGGVSIVLLCAMCKGRLHACWWPGDANPRLHVVPCERCAGTKR